MRQADVYVGHDYTLNPNSHCGTPRLRVLTKPAGGRTLVKVIEADPDGTHRSLARGKKVEISTRDLHQTWEAWLGGAADRAAAEQARELELQQRRRASSDAWYEQVTRDPNRLLPSHYEDQDDESAQHLFGDRYCRPHEVTAPELQPFADLMAHWPALLRRDVLAAADTSQDQLYADGTVGAVLGRVARFLTVTGTGAVPRWLAPRRVLSSSLGAFVQALQTEAKDTGTRLVQPWAPTSTTQDALPQPGWLQVRVVHGERGRYMHAASCSTLRKVDARHYESYPWWQLSIVADAFCSKCKGPNLANPREVAHLALAAAVWEARGRTHIEPWQRVAFAQLVGATLVEQAASGRQPGNKVDRVLAKLATRRLEHKETYRVLNWLADGARDEVASRLAAQRLNLAFKALPKAQRPAKVPCDVTANVVGVHLRTLREHDPFLDPYLVLFGDPNAR